tara:strand:- start:28 stop:468 length:441 start_codon:yes stop_codon:yes gene_type:complete
MANYKEPVEKRLLASNIAEEKCEDYLNTVKGLHWSRFGFDETNNNVPFAQFSKVPKLIRNSPDYICVSNKSFFIETKGFVGYLKIKQDDLKGYDFWNNIMDLYFFVYDCMNKKHYKLSYDDIKKKIKTSEVSNYPDNNKIYYKVKL